MAQAKAVEMSEQFLSVIREWQKLEDVTIQFSEEMLKKTKNPLIRTTMEMIRHDSEKHKVMQQMLIDSLTKEALHLRPDELSLLAGGIEKHMEAEAKSIELAEAALAGSELFVTKYILTNLIADEKKHHSLLGQLSDLKKATVFVT